MSAIMKAAAELIRATYWDKEPSEDEQEAAKLIALAARREHDNLRAQLAAAEGERVELRLLVKTSEEINNDTVERLAAATQRADEAEDQNRALNETLRQMIKHAKMDNGGPAEDVGRLLVARVTAATQRAEEAEALAAKLELALRCALNGARIGREISAAFAALAATASPATACGACQHRGGDHGNDGCVVRRCYCLGFVAPASPATTKEEP